MTATPSGWEMTAMKIGQSEEVNSLMIGSFASSGSSPRAPSTRSLTRRRASSVEVSESNSTNREETLWRLEEVSLFTPSSPSTASSSGRVTSDSISEGATPG
ncbi:MAG: hypothetical protein A2Z99_17770 [Treponema sp. GWB1_62_6]|nr:MAG: hypothetical protein A2Z99_17770 [Treponema sp. GWB1_62_6]